MSERPNTSAAVAELAANGSGRDFVVGDVHGHFATLERALETLRYDPNQDRLVSLGDLIDHGPRYG